MITGFAHYQVTGFRLEVRLATNELQPSPYNLYPKVTGGND